MCSTPVTFTGSKSNQKNDRDQNICSRCTNRAFLHGEKRMVKRAVKIVSKTNKGNAIRYWYKMYKYFIKDKG